MASERTQAAVDTLENGNISNFKVWLKRASKLEILDAIEYAQQYGHGRHVIINKMRMYLEE